MSFNSLFGLGTHSADSNLEGFWPLQETTGTQATDYSGNARHGTITGMGANPVTATGPNGWLTSAYDFNGSTHYVSLPSTVLDACETNNEISVGCFGNPDASASDGTFFGQWQATLQFILWQDVGGAGVGAAFIDGNTGVSVGTDNADSLVGNWKSIIAARSTSVKKVYVDASETATSAHSDTFPSAVNTVGIGSDKGGSASRSLDGKMAGGFLFSRYLTPTEVGEIDAGPELENTVAPTVSGDTAQGATLTCSPGTWALPSPFASGANGTPTYQYQWTRDGGDISGATSSTYVTQAADIGTAVGCKVLGVNDGGSDSAEQTASSNTISVVAAGPTYRMNMQLFIPTQV